MKRFLLWAWIVGAYAGAFVTAAPLWMRDYHPNTPLRRLMELDR